MTMSKDYRVSIDRYVPSGGGPVVEPVAVGGRHLGLVGAPEPAVDVLGEEARGVAPVKVAEPARRPEVLGAANVRLQKVVLLLRLDGHEVHAALPAVVPRVEPVPLGVLQLRVVRLPAEPVEVVSEAGVALATHSWKKFQKS